MMSMVSRIAVPAVMTSSTISTRPRERRADEVAALAVVLRFLAVERERHVAAVLLGERDGRRRRERNALVGRAEEHVELDAGLDDRLRVAGAERASAPPSLKSPALKKYGTGPAGLQRELAEAQHLLREDHLDELFLVRSHAGPARPCVSWPDGRGSSMRIITLNCNGIRSAASKGLFHWLPAQGADVVCLQETKAQEHQLGDGCFRADRLSLPLLRCEEAATAASRSTRGRSPTGSSRVSASRNSTPKAATSRPGSDASRSSRCTCPRAPPGPSARRSKFRFLDEFLPHLQKLGRRDRDFILCGDWNIAHKEIDLKNWHSNQKNSGFLPEERAWLDRVFDELGFVDVFREVNPRPDQYTWWSNRGQAWAKNVGWRIDYQIASPRLARARALGVDLQRDAGSPTTRRSRSTTTVSMRQRWACAQAVSRAAPRSPRCSSASRRASLTR